MIVVENGISFGGARGGMLPLNNATIPNIGVLEPLGKWNRASETNRSVRQDHSEATSGCLRPSAVASFLHSGLPRHENKPEASEAIN